MIYVSEATQSVCLNVEDPFMLRSMIQQSRVLADDRCNFAAKHTLRTTKLLRNLGFDIPSPIRYQYGWPGKYKPYDHQIEMAEFWTFNKRGFNLSEPGTMKTAAALWASDYLMNIGEVKKCLILAPLSTLETVWLQDIFDTLMHRQAVVVHGDRDKRKRALASDSDYFILNHDGVKIGPIARIIKENKDINLIIVDEGDEFRNGKSEKYKALADMIRPDCCLWWQTGTPTPNEPADAWAQARLINPKGVPKFFGQFRRETMVQFSPFRWVPRRGAQNTVYDAMQPGIRFMKKDCIDLPPVVPHKRQAELTLEQKKAFKDMKDNMYLDAVRHQLDGQSISAVHAADQIMKLRQILCGVVKHPENDTYVELPHGPRLQELLYCISKAVAKVIVIVPFKGILKSLARDIGKHYSVDILNGDVSPGQRRDIIYRFKNTPDPHVLLCHPRVMSHGLNLTEADTTILYAPISSNSQFQQVIERFNRAGQKHTMNLVRIAAHPIEWEIYKATDVATMSQAVMLDLYKKIVSL